jgi:hypothetical protein
MCGSSGWIDSQQASRYVLDCPAIVDRVSGRGRQRPWICSQRVPLAMPS